MEKALIFDSSSIISLSLIGMIDVLEKLKKIFNGKFFITEQVKYEVIDRPLKVKKFELGALKIKNLLDIGVLELPSAAEKKHIDKRTKQILDRANNIFLAKSRYGKDKFIHLIDDGEASCLALSELLNSKKIKNIIVVDERTTRMLSENIENLHKLFEKKLHTEVKKQGSFNIEAKFIRSSELLYVAYKKNLIDIKNHKAEILDALLYATKFSGSAISKDEIEEMKRM